MFLPFDASIWFYRQPVDFRKQIDGLVILVTDILEQNPTCGQLFVFRNKQADKVKLLYWEDNGFWLLYKRIEQGRFIFPTQSASAMSLSKSQLQWLLSGLDIARHKALEPLVYQHFV